MSDHASDFIRYLETLNERNRGALAALRRSLAFAPGAYPPAYPYVEPFIAKERHAQDSLRLAHYTVAALYARHPQLGERSFASALGLLFTRRDSASIEHRFVALLGADAGNLPNYLRQAVSLLAAEGIGVDYAALLGDLRAWLNPQADPDRIRQRWARDFYRATQAEAVTDESTAN